MDIHHPWRDLRNRPHIIVEWSTLPPGLSGATDGQRIYMHKRLKQAERRCTLTHELVHIDLGHEGCQPPAVERRVRYQTARRLITLSHAIRTSQWTTDLYEATAELWVTPRVLCDYIQSLSEEEWAHIDRAVRAKEA